MGLEAFIGIKVFDRDGKVIIRRKKRSRSFVRGFNHVLCAQMRSETTPAPAIQTRDTSNVNQSIRTANSPFWADAPAGNTLYGIVVGTDSTPVDIEQYALVAKCTHGSGANQLVYQACTCTWLGVAAGAASFTVDRSMLNNSGAPVAVEEIGIYIESAKLGAVLIYIMGMRDLYSLAIPDGGGITVTYTIGIVA